MDETAFPQDNPQTLIEGKINSIKHDFNKIKDANEDIAEMFQSLDNKIMKLKKMYNEFLDANKNELFVFGLDSFNFQSKIIDVESGHMKSFCNLIFNRIYCDYYRLHSLIKNYLKKNIKDERLLMKANLTKPSFPKYDYLNIYKPYSFDIITEVFNDIMNYITLLTDHSKKLELDLNSYKVKGKIGLNINNFVHSYEYKNVILREEINLYLNYLNFFMNLHTKYLSRFITKMRIMHGQITHDIKFDDNLFAYNKDSGSELGSLDNLEDILGVDNSELGVKRETDENLVIGNLENTIKREITQNKGLFKTKSKIDLVGEIEQIQEIIHEEGEKDNEKDNGKIDTKQTNVVKKVTIDSGIYIKEEDISGNQNSDSSSVNSSQSQKLNDTEERKKESVPTPNPETKPVPPPKQAKVNRSLPRKKIV